MSFLDEVREALRVLRSAGPRQPTGVSLAAMRETLIQARVGLSELREGVDQADRRLAREQGELETIRRRGRMATDIGDAETAAVAARFESQHAERSDELGDRRDAVEGRGVRGQAARDVPKPEMRFVSDGAVADRQHRQARKRMRGIARDLAAAVTAEGFTSVADAIGRR